MAEQPRGTRLQELVEIMDRLRQECPWDREQTHRSLARYLLEETYETLEAIESGDRDHLREELGDLLLQVLFHARIASEQPDGFDVDDVAGGIADKLVYRHPHVFAGLEVGSADEVDANWETLKAAEKQRDSPLDGIPAALPALAYADKVTGRRARAALPPDARVAPASGAPTHAGSGGSAHAGSGGSADAGSGASGGIGDELLSLVLRARAEGVD